MYDLLKGHQVHCFDCQLRLNTLGGKVPRKDRNYPENFYIFDDWDEQNPVVHVIENGVFVDVQPLYIFEAKGYPVYDGYGELTLAETKEDLKTMIRDNKEAIMEFNRLFKEMGLNVLFDKCRTQPECIEELSAKTETIHNCTHRVFREKWYNDEDCALF